MRIDCGRASALVLWVAGSACAVGAGGSDFESDEPPYAPGTGSGMGAGSAPGGSLDVSAGTGQPPDGSDACAGDSYVGEPVVLDMMLMVDQSGSMTEPVSGGTRWSAVTAALEGFVSQSPQTDGIGVGLQYFPHVEVAPACPASCMDCTCLSQQCNCTSCTCINGACSCNAQSVASSCKLSDYQDPEVEIEALPGAKSAIVQSLADHAPNGATPTRVALEGAIAHAKKWAASHPTHKVIVVLATDGLPTDGECSPNGLGQSVAAAKAGLPEVPTYVIGVGPALGNLHQIASAGGTKAALLVDGGGNVQQEFLDAMNDIGKSALACTFEIPEPKSGQLDYDMVNVQFTGDGKNAKTVKYVGSASNCGADGGWYYDNPQKPTQIIVCEQTCDVFEADPGGKVDILVGCKTEAK